MIGIIGAMEEEVEAILALMEINKKEMNHGYTFYEGTMAKKDIVLVQGGKRKNSNHCAQTDYEINQNLYRLVAGAPFDFVGS